MDSRSRAFDASHPCVPAAYFCGMVGLTMLCMQPVLVAVSLAGALAFSLAARGAGATARGLRWQLPAVALIALLNPLLTAAGSTLLVRVGPVAVYAEAVLFGLCAGASLVATVLWFEGAAAVLTQDRVMALAARPAPVVALSASMVSRLVPTLLRRARAASEVRAAAGRGAGGGPRALLASAAERTGALVAWSLSDSIEAADSMRARGWGSGARRTAWRERELSGRDVAALAAVVALLALCSLLGWEACSQFAFYPRASRLVAWWGYVPYAAYALLPTALDVIGRLSWSR